MKHHNNKTNQFLDAEVSKTLQCFDNLEDIEVNPFFYTRLQKHLDNSDVKEMPSFSKLFYGHLLAPAVIGLIIVLNLITVVVFLKNQEQNFVDRQTYIEVITDDYSQSGSYILSEMNRN